VVLDHGRIVAQGNHDELLVTSELYREIVAGTSSAEDVIADSDTDALEQVLATNAGSEPNAGGRL